MRPQNTSQIGRVAVNAFQHFDRRHFKAGWAFDPIQHIAKPRSAMAPVSQSACEYTSWRPAPRTPGGRSKTCGRACRCARR
jgi:hypothetical protein